MSGKENDLWKITSTLDPLTGDRLNYNVRSSSFSCDISIKYKHSYDSEF